MKKRILGLDWKKVKFGSWVERLNSRQELRGLSDRQLKDIGISRVEAQAEVRKPFWKA